MKNWKGRAVLSFSREAGGAAVIAPVLELIAKAGGDVRLFGKDKAVDIFSQRRVPCAPMIDLEDLERDCRKRWGRLPDLVFTSATSLPQLDMTEKLLWRWAAERGCPSAAAIDQWQNYAVRFSGVAPPERLAFLPDAIFVMDDEARREAAADGLPADRLRIVGQPALEETASVGRKLDRAAIRERLGAGPRDFLVVFAAEALKAHFGSLGYDEQTTADFLIDELVKIAPRSRRPLRLLIKLHPQNTRDEFADHLRSCGLSSSMGGMELPAVEAIRAADLVVGMTSIFLVQAVLMGAATLSLQLGATGPSLLTVTKSGALPFLTDAGRARALLSQLVLEPAARKAHVARQSLWGRSFSGSARRMARACEELILRKGALC